MQRGFLLSDVRVVEIGEGRVGPGAGLLLADLGAEVIKVESITRVDHTRVSTLSASVPSSKPWECSPGFMIRNHGKLGITLDLAKPKGREAFRRLIKVSDIFFSNEAVGVAEKLGITYEDLVKVNPQIVYLASTGFGRAGAYAKHVAMGGSIDAAAGLFGLRDYGDGDGRSVTPNTHCDSIAAATNAFAIIVGLYYRKKTGRGTFIDASMVEPSISHIGEAIMDYSMNRRIGHSLGNRDIARSPQGCYRCQGEDEWVTLSVSSDEEWQRLTAVMGNPQLAQDERFVGVLERLRNQDELDKLIGAWTIQHGKFEVTRLLQQAGIAAGAVSNNADIYSDPHVKERGLLEVIEHPEAGSHTYAGRLWKLAETEVPKRTHAPTLGEHNDYVLRQIAGLTPEEMSELEREGIIGTTPLVPPQR
ncbi:MAG: CoA transferase [Dehalococcoidales bacterium]|nr:CoA transferase [Dehalococcoidales bacterium]